MTARGRTVYSTEARKACPTCGWPEDDCRCSARLDEALPTRLTAVLRLEKKGRAGKCVTVLDGLPRNVPFVRELASELKRSCGTGGSIVNGTVELQGDRRDHLRALLAAKGWVVKG